MRSSIFARFDSRRPDEARTVCQVHLDQFTSETGKSVNDQYARLLRRSTAVHGGHWPSVRPEIILGQILAACVHPFAAWRRFSRSRRLLILGAYAATGYVIVLGLLLVLRFA